MYRNLTIRALTVAVLLLGILPVPSSAAEPSAADIEFFEKRVRPVLAENCYRCHGDKRQRGGLRLDRGEAILTGGDQGPAVVPGDPDESLLIQAIRYSDLGFQMPPRGKLADDDIEAITAWVARGAVAPRDTPRDGAPQPKSEFDLAERAEHWAYQPVRPVAIPAITDSSWPTTPIDCFLLARLEEANLRPAAPAGRSALIRRVTFGLTGLPPTPDEVARFLADDSPDAWPRLIDRLLASPHYGEHWGRHWLDLVRYAETLGHEFDYDVFHAWRYRDYVIRAFNADVPYDQFVVEHLAGDLLEPPRRGAEGTNESIIGTAFFWLGEATHSPVDVRQAQAERIENQIDVLGKALLAQTIACARCHDHKFDAISTRDYYALAGYLKSSRYQQASIDPPERIAEKARRLAELCADAQAAAVRSVLPSWRAGAEQVADYLLAAQEVIGARSNSAVSPQESAELANGGDVIGDVASRRQLDARRLDRWVRALQDEALREPSHPLHAWADLSAAVDHAGEPFMRMADTLRQVVGRRAAQSRSSASTYDVLDDFSEPHLDGWFATGEAFLDVVTHDGDLVLGPSADDPIVALRRGGCVASDAVSRRLEGALRSPSFTISAPYLHVRLAGRGGRVNVVVDGFTIIRDPIYGHLTAEPRGDQFAWQTIQLDKWIGHRAYVELVDSSVPNLSQSFTDAEANDRYLVVDCICRSHEASPPTDPPAATDLAVLSPEPPDSLEALARAYRQLLLADLDAAALDQSPRRIGSAATIDLWNWLLSGDLLPLGDVPEGDSASRQRLAELLAEYRELEAATAAPTYVPALADGTGEDEAVFVRGSHKVLGDVVPRRCLEVFGEMSPADGPGSGRLELARKLVEPDNPLLARVMVNRIWQHHFGRGIVATPDDFGRMGQQPTHPELLDYLAAEFIRSGWSIKHMHRLLLTSTTYQMSSAVNARQQTIDPDNKLLAHMPVRRLSAESIRDNLLAVSGRLDRAMYGPSVPPHLTPYMSGTGRPATSGPLDGDGRRSIYTQVRRNFLPPLWLAFDYPIPLSTIGQRSTSNVPAQALALMNDPLVIQQARRWAERLLAENPGPPRQRINQLYQEAFARAPTDDERHQAESFLTTASDSHQREAADAELRRWTDLCHVLLNVKEFIFVE